MNKIYSLLLVFLAVWCEAAAAAPWRAGAAAVDITPAQPILLCGHARDHRSEGTLHPIHAKALVIEDEQGNRTAIVTADLIAFTGDMSDTIAARVHDRVGISRERILFNASHTHCGPFVRGHGLSFYGFSPEDQAIISDYTEKLEDKIVELVAEAIGKMRPAELAFNKDKATFGANRRQFKDGRYEKMGVNLNGLVDHQVPVLSVRDEQGHLMAVLFGYACHNTTLGPAVYRFNGDYAGYAQTVLEKNHPGAVALFAIGCGGDANPIKWNGKNPEQAEAYGNDLAAAVDRALSQPQIPLAGKLAVAYQTVELPFATPLSLEDIERLHQSPDRGAQVNAKFLLHHAAKHGRALQGYPCPMQVFQFGKDLSLVALSGEPCAGYALRLREELSGQPIWVAGYSNDLFGYVPTEQILKEGGYESKDWTGWSSPFQVGIEDRIITLAKKLVSQTTEAVQVAK